MKSIKPDSKRAQYVPKFSASLLTVLMLLLAFVGIVAVQLKAPHAAKASESAKVYYGVFNHNNFDSLSDITNFETEAQKPVSIIHAYQSWGDTDGTQNFKSAWATLVREHGSMPMITWEPWVSTGEPTQPAYSLANIINGTYDAYITQFANDVKSWSHPLFLRFAHEMNGNWYPWAEQINGNSAGQYVQAWRHVRDIFAQNNVSNVTWVWCPNRLYEDSTALSSLYPGDAGVDWTCLDAYNHGPAGNKAWKTFSQLITPTYDNLLAVAPSKPIMLGETASEEIGGIKSDWIADAFQTQLPNNFPKIRAVLWFDINKVYNWPINSSPAAQNAFATAIASDYYASNSFGSVAESPIQPTPPPPPVITQSLPATADAYVSGSSNEKGSSFGNMSYFWVKGSPVNTTYLRFDLRNLAGKNIISAKLQMQVTDNSSVGNQTIVLANNSWNESKINYNNKPALSSSVIGTLAPAGKHDVWITADVSTALKEKAGQIVSLGLTQASTDGIKFASRESGYAPVLVVAYQ